jgi:uncharacterized protein YcgL (UPF0745 family)
MRYMIREVFECKRGKAPEIVNDLKIIVDALKNQGIPDHKIYVDITERMDTVIHEYEVDSLDQYFTNQRGFYINLAPEARQLVDHYNEHTVAGRREIYEVIL